MRNYEMMVILDPDTPFDESKKFLHETFKSNDVKVLEEKDMGVRDLAYEINRKKRGHYYLLNLESEQNVLLNVNREFKLNTGVLRQLTVKQGK